MTDAILLGFTWVGGLCCASGTLLALLWMVDRVVAKVLRAVDWWIPFVRFLCLDGDTKQAFRDSADLMKLKAEQPLPPWPSEDEC